MLTPRPLPLQAAQRDLEWAEAGAIRFVNGSEAGNARSAAEEAHARAVAAMGAPKAIMGAWCTC